jgi:hypothetical protein
MILEFAQKSFPSHQMEVILHQHITMHFYLLALCAFAQIAQKFEPISIVPEILFPTIAPCRDVVHRTSELNPSRS